MGYAGVVRPPGAAPTDPLVFQPGARRHEQGMPSLPGVAASRAGLDLLLQVGMPTVEAHVKVGGVGSVVAEIIADYGVACRLMRIGVEQPFGRRGGSEEFLNKANGLSADAVVSRVRAFFGRESSS